MDKLRGLLMVALGVFALFRGIVMHSHPHAWMAMVLGVVAVALGGWRLLRRAPEKLP